MSDRVVYILYPLAEMIKCDFCRKEPKPQGIRESGVFKAASRKGNYVQHLKKLHQVSSENIKIRCSVCGRVSDKPSGTAWRDTRRHYRNEHQSPLRVEMQETVQPNFEDEINPSIADNEEATANLDRSADSVASQRIENLPSSSTVEVIDLRVPKTIETEKMIVIGKSLSRPLPPPPPKQWNNPHNSFDALVSSCVPDSPPTADAVIEKQDQQSKSRIFQGMGQLFNLIFKTAAECLALVHSTPKEPDQQEKPAEAQQKAAIDFPPIDAHVSRIVPKARPSIRTCSKRRLFSPAPISPRKKPYVEL